MPAQLVSGEGSVLACGGPSSAVLLCAYMAETK